MTGAKPCAGEVSNGAAVFQPLRSQRVFEGVVEQIRDAIFSGRLRAGDRLPAEVELARQFRVSRAAVREAMRVLELTGLLSVRPGAGGGIFVSDAVHRPLDDVFETMYRLDRFGLDDFFRARIVFESALAEAAAQSATDADLQALEKVVEGEGSAENAAFPGMRAFHRLVACATHNPLLESVMIAFSALSDRLGVAWRADPRAFEVSRHDHRAILAAIRRRDSSLAKRLMAEHLARIQPLISRPEG